MTDFAEPDTAAAEDSSDFLTNEELIGRHLIVVPKKLETIKAEPGSVWPDGKEKKDYDRVTADVIVLDGRKNPKIRAFPHFERDKYITAYKLVAALKKHVGTGTPVLGYLGMEGKAYTLDPTPEKGPEPATQAAWEQYESGQASSVPQSEKPPF